MEPEILTFPTSLESEIQVCIASPSQFIQEHQQQLFPDWNVPVATVILFLQKTTASLRESTHQTVLEKDLLRAKFIRFGCNLIFKLHDEGYQADLCDPRSGYPLLARQNNLTINDNVLVHSLLHYPLTSYKNCSILEHPKWGDKIYPSTVLTSASSKVLKSFLAKLFSESCSRKSI